jgi:hypothetical protein
VAHIPMQVDWRQKWLAVPYNGKTRVLQGLSSSSPQQLLLHIELVTASSSASKPLAAIHPAVQPLLTEFSDPFTEPSGLPPSWSCDHEIPLVPGAQPVYICSYRYPPR